MKVKQFVEAKWKNVAIIVLLLCMLILPAIPAIADVMHIREGGAAGATDATDVSVAELGSATYDDAQDFINFFGDRTLMSGGAITAHGDADGSVAIAACTAWAKETDSDTAVGKFFDYAGKAKQTLTDLIANLIYLDYNAGTPQIVVATAPVTYGFQQDHILIGVVFQQGNAVHIFQSSNVGIQGINRAFMHAVEHDGAHRSSGLVTSDGGSLALSVTTGIIYAGLNRQTTTVDGSTWSYWYTSDSGSTWSEDTSQSALVQSYNDITSGKVALGSNKFGVHWVYVDYEGSHLHIVYGQGNYAAPQAEEATVPSVLPPIVVGYSVLLAKIINQEGTNDLIITYPWTTVFTSSLATDHGSLGGLGDDDHPQYIKDTEFTQDSGFLVGTGAGTFAEETGATLRTSMGTYSTAETDSAIDTDVATHAAIKSANAILGHVIVEDASKVDVDGDGKLTLGSDVLLEADLENMPTEDESAKAPTSEWAFDHENDGSIHTTITTAEVTLYVDAGSGNDDNAGTSGSPKATIQGALDALPTVIAHTSTICVRGQQSYPENNTQLGFSRFDTLASIIIKAVNSNDENMYDTSQASGGGNDYLDDSGESWSVDQFNGAYIWIYEGTGAGQIRTISDTTATRITVSVAWATNPDATSYYVIGGGATLTGTSSYHFYNSGKVVNFYGFKHSGATVYNARFSEFASGGYFYNYDTGIRSLNLYNFPRVSVYYNYIATTSIGIYANAAVSVTPRANVITGATDGVIVDRGSIAIMTGIVGQKNFISDCTRGIRVLPTMAGCEAASYQVFSACGTDISPVSPTTAPAWWT